ncbi:MAG: hypothetical protein JSR82_18565 [Verrucomicrobia bacterium]|nr:hypothetical protein [Verrucomicrobiota bacterium]
MKVLRSIPLLAAAVLTAVPLAAQPALTRQAAHAEALAMIRSGDEESGAALARLYEAQFGRDEQGGELLLEIALARCSKAWPALEAEALERAVTALRDFRRSYRRHPRAAEAYLAQAELALLSPEPDYDLARNAARLARGASPSPKVQERLDRFAIQLALLAESGEDPEQDIQAFLRRWPDSTLAPEVRFEAATLAWRRGQIELARRRWESLADDLPGHPLAAAALRWAAEASLAEGTTASARAAVDFFGSAAFLAGSSEPLRGQAERGRIRALLRLGRDAEAASLAEARLAQKWEGDTLLLEAQSRLAEAMRDPSRRVETLVELDSAVTDPTLSPAARRALLTSLAELQGLSATDALRDALAIQEGPGLVWRFRAGFLLAERLQTEARWEEAARVFAQLAQLGGPLAGEAAARLSRGRLEHFIWAPETPEPTPEPSPGSAE